MRVYICFFIASFSSSLSSMENTKELPTIQIECSDGITCTTSTDELSACYIISLMIDDIGHSIFKEPIPLPISSQHCNTFFMLIKKHKSELDEALMFLPIQTLNVLAKFAHYLENESFEHAVFEALANNIILFDQPSSLTNFDTIIVEQMIHKFSQPMVKEYSSPGSETTSFALYNTAGNNFKKNFEQDLKKQHIYSLCLSPDTTYLAVGLSTIIQLYCVTDTNEYLRNYELSLSAHQIHSLCFHPSLKLLASASCCPAQVTIWRLNTQKIMQKWNLSSIVQSLCWNNNGTLLAAGTEKDTLTIWNIKSENMPITLPTNNSNYIASNSTIWSIDFSPNSRYLATSKFDHTIKIWDLTTKQCIQTLTNHSGCINTVRYSPNGKYIASAANDRTAKIWNSANGQLLITLHLKEQQLATLIRPLSPHSLCWSPDSNYIAASSFDNRIRLWNVQVLHTLHKMQQQSKNEDFLDDEKKESRQPTIIQKLGTLKTFLNNSALSILISGIHHHLVWRYQDHISVLLP